MEFLGRFMLDSMSRKFGEADAGVAVLHAPYGLRGWKGVISVCGVSRTWPNISLDDA